ncbi:hypothetical protein [Aurantimonas coralicida]|uniref:hypothetical protein n=1 Tax=Aurantimonas coralicida TaxID=182270 RepID=UPI0023A662F3|nr:hypothetical protein [Aurantimonas coralicida]MDE0922691.1 hypothetical protein [Aurantimonas coralicida]
MADLSGVLRKTIDGLPRATPQMRAKVYEKARAAIQRQIQAANPPLAEEVVAARQAALEDAIARTEQHYLDQDGDGGEPAAAAPAAPVAASPASAPADAPAAPSEDMSPRSELRPSEPPRSQTPPAERPRAPQSDSRIEPSFDGGRPDAAAAAAAAAGGANTHSAWERETPATPTPSSTKPQGAGTGAGAASPARPGPAKDAGRSDPPPFFPVSAEEPEGGARPAAVGAPFIVPSQESGRSGPAVAGTDDAHDDEDRLPAGIRSDDDLIPAADLTAPRYSARQRRKSGGAGNRGAITAVAAVLILGGLGTAGWMYREEIQAMLVDPAGLETIATNNADGTPAPTPTDEAGTDVAAVDPAAETPDAEGETAPETTTPARESTRQFTQRLLPDGTEVDEGPAEVAPNAFDEGTNIAAASPVETPDLSGNPTIASEIGENPEVVGAPETPGETAAETPDAAPTEDAAAGETEVAAADPSEDGVGVAQDAVFYQERTETVPGTQESGDVVWSVVNESPTEGQPPEPAIRAEAEIPDENLKMTMTIRRNADPTLPASHVIELLFTTPENFAGGSVANVQRLALKPSEQARGEPLIGVAGKISDGFFIIALNNLEQAMQNNMALLQNEQWIDIPIAYASGRRALMSIEKGVPGDRVFKEAIEAWKAKT